MRRNILVTGATGKQGSALIRAIVDPTERDNEHEYHIYALLRKASSSSLKYPKVLEKRSSVTIVEGNLDARGSILKIFEDAKRDGGFWGVFMVLAFPGLGVDASGEERQGKMLADLSLQFRVEAFIYSSAMTAGPKYENELKFSGKAKVNVERYIMSMGEKGLPWIILKPGFFMENFDGFRGAVAVSVLRKGLKPDTTISLIATDDIGNVAAAVFKNYENYKHRSLVLVSEFLTLEQVEESHQRATGKPISAVPVAFGWALNKWNTNTRELVVKGIELNHHARTEGEYPTCHDEIEVARKAYKMKTYYEWRSQRKAGEKLPGP